MSTKTLVVVRQASKSTTGGGEFRVGELVDQRRALPSAEKS
jgi:hypothetical protein